MYIDDANTIRLDDVFLDVLAHDPHAEVRRAVLAVTIPTEANMDALIGRCRDIDPTVRRHFFASKLGQLDLASLTVGQRDLILRAGLFDR